MTQLKKTFYMPVEVSLELSDVFHMTRWDDYLMKTIDTMTFEPNFLGITENRTKDSDRKFEITLKEIKD